eukprot:COSAG06_NODE_14234_length_1176_cov_2.991643_2_plen_167_part_00
MLLLLLLLPSSSYQRSSCSNSRRYYGDQQEFRQRQEPKGSFSLRGAKAQLNDAENKGLPTPKVFVVQCEVRVRLCLSFFPGARGGGGGGGVFWPNPHHITTHIAQPTGSPGPCVPSLVGVRLLGPLWRWRLSLSHMHGAVYGLRRAVIFTSRSPRCGKTRLSGLRS